MSYLVALAEILLAQPDAHCSVSRLQEFVLLAPYAGLASGAATFDGVKQFAFLAVAPDGLFVVAEHCCDFYERALNGSQFLDLFGVNLRWLTARAFTAWQALPP